MNEEKPTAEAHALVPLGDEDERLFRQILLPLRDGRPSWEVFKGRKADDWQVSVDRESLCPSCADAKDRYTKDGASSQGVLATTVGRLGKHKVRAFEKPEDDNAAHCEYDLRTRGDGTAISNGQREKICADLLDGALSDNKHPPLLR